MNDIKGTTFDLRDIVQELSAGSYSRVDVQGPLLAGKKEISQRLVQIMTASQEVVFSGSIPFTLHLQSDLLTGLVRRKGTPYSLTDVLNSYAEYVPLRKGFICANFLSASEVALPQFYFLSERFLASKEDGAFFEGVLGSAQEIGIRKDYYFSSPARPNHFIKVTEKNGLLNGLTYSSPAVMQSDGKSIYTQLELGTEAELQVFTTESLLKKFEGHLLPVFEIAFEYRVWEWRGIRILYSQVPFGQDYVEMIAPRGIAQRVDFDEVKCELGIEKRPAISGWRQVLSKVGLPVKRDAVAYDICPLSQAGKHTLDLMRKGYPELTISLQTRGAEFRQAAQQVMEEVCQCLPQKEYTVVLPWQDGLAWLPSVAKVYPHSSICHVRSLFSPDSLSSQVDLLSGIITHNVPVLLLTPLLASGLTVREYILWLIQSGITQDKITVASLLLTPEATHEIRSHFPDLTLLTASLEDGVDTHGFIYPGLGDFAGKYFYDLSPQDLDYFLGISHISKEQEKQFLYALGQHSLGEMLSKLIVRDGQDAQVARKVHKELREAGLEVWEPERRLRIDTGLLHSVQEVTAVIKSAVNQHPAAIICIEGLSGTGKGSTALALQNELPAWHVSLGEIYRYLAYCSLQGLDYAQVVPRLHYEVRKNSLFLFDDQVNISTSLARQLRSQELEAIVAMVAEQSQVLVMQFLVQFLADYKQNARMRPLIIEGRAHHLDFLPASLRVELRADPAIRAERRWSDYYLATLLASK